MKRVAFWVRGRARTTSARCRHTRILLPRNFSIHQPQPPPRTCTRCTRITRVLAHEPNGLHREPFVGGGTSTHHSFHHFPLHSSNYFPFLTLDSHPFCILPPFRFILPFSVLFYILSHPLFHLDNSTRQPHLFFYLLPCSIHSFFLLYLYNKP